MTGSEPAGPTGAGVGDGRRPVEALLEDARRGLRRMGPVEAAASVAAGGVLVDIRPHEDRLGEGVIPGAWIVDRNVLEWRLDPASPDRLAGVDSDLYDRHVVVVCNEGYASSLAAASLRRLGLSGATDVDGGYRAWLAAGLPVAPGPGPAQAGGSGQARGSAPVSPSMATPAGGAPA